MIRLKNKKQVEGLRESGKLLVEAMNLAEELAVPGGVLIDIDRRVGDFIRSKNGIPIFKGYNGFPGNICTSINETVIHGIPDKTVLKNGDIFGIDIGVSLNGLITDSAITVIVGNVTSPEKKKLVEETEKCLGKAIAAAQHGKRLKEIGKAVTQSAAPFGYGIVHQFCGHGVGFAVHEDPQISNCFPSHGDNPRLKPGMVLAIEPMVCLGTGDVETMQDGFTVKTRDRRPAAHFEHTVVIHRDYTEILTLR